MRRKLRSLLALCALATAFPLVAAARPAAPERALTQHVASASAHVLLGSFGSTMLGLSGLDPARRSAPAADLGARAAAWADDLARLVVEQGWTEWDWEAINAASTAALLRAPISRDPINWQAIVSQRTPASWADVRRVLEQRRPELANWRLAVVESSRLVRELALEVAPQQPLPEASKPAAGEAPLEEPAAVMGLADAGAAEKTAPPARNRKARFFAPSAPAWPRLDGKPATSESLWQKRTQAYAPRPTAGSPELPPAPRQTIAGSSPGSLLLHAAWSAARTSAVVDWERLGTSFAKAGAELRSMIAAWPRPSERETPAPVARRSGVICPWLQESFGSSAASDAPPSNAAARAAAESWAMWRDALAARPRLAR